MATKSKTADTPDADTGVDEDATTTSAPAAPAPKPAQQSVGKAGGWVLTDQGWKPADHVK